MDLFSSENAKHQAKFAAKQREMGRKARKIWATDEEIEALREYLETLREEERSKPSGAAVVAAPEGLEWDEP